MCATCGCSDDAKPKIVNMQTGKSISVGNEREQSPDHTHVHDHEHSHEHTHPHDREQSPDHTHAHDHEHSHDRAHAHDHEHSHDRAHAHDHEHSHDHTHAHDREHSHDIEHAHPNRQESPIGTSITSNSSNIVSLEEQILGKNDQLAERNRAWFRNLNILALNFVSSPGAGKTALLECTIKALQSTFNIAVVEGDQATLNDAERIKKTGCKVVQINTGAGCHLDADMVSTGIKQLEPPQDSIVFIENVGNLVCPAMFDLGEKCKVAVLSITEGEDKPIKYPHMFRAAEILLLTKKDLLPHLNFDVEACKQFARSVNPRIKIFEISAQSGEGMEAWYQWIKDQALRLAHQSADGKYK
jgi:hydrogenase nickel incorporation protein HypB